MKEEAEKHAAEDAEKKEFVEVKNRADMMAHEVKKNLDEHGDKLPEDEKKAIEDAREKLVSTLESDDKAAIESALEELMQKSHKLAEILYKESNDEGAAAGEAGPAPEGGEEKKSGDDDVIDADYTVKQ